MLAASTASFTRDEAESRIASSVGGGVKTELTTELADAYAPLA